MGNKGSGDKGKWLSSEAHGGRQRDWRFKIRDLRDSRLEIGRMIVRLRNHSGHGPKSHRNNAKDGFSSQEGHRVSRADLMISVVTDMVELIKLTGGLVANFPRPGDRTRVANKGDILKCVRFRAFFLVQNRTKSRKNAQKRAKTCKNVPKDDTKDGFFATDLFKPCQVRRLVSSLKFSAISHQYSVFSSHRPATCNSRTEMGVEGCRAAFRGSSRATESLRGQAVDSTND